MAGPNGDDQPPLSKPPEDDKDSESDDGDAAEEVTIHIFTLWPFIFKYYSNTFSSHVFAISNNCLRVTDSGGIALSSVVEAKRTSETERRPRN